MKESQRVHLGDVCAISSTLVDPRQLRFRKAPHVGGANIESMTGRVFRLKTAEEEGLKSGKFLFDDQAVLYSKIRPYLMKAARPDFQGLCSADIYPLSPILSRLDRNFLFHLLLTPQFTDYAITGSARAGMPKVNRDHLFAFEFSLPPLSEQQRIVGILDKAFEGIATAKANAEQNLKNARAIFESHLQSVFTLYGNRMTVPIGDVGQVFDGPHATPKTVDEGPIFLGISALHDGVINLGETRHVTPGDFRQWTRRVKPQADDVVFSYETRLGQAAIVPAGLECCLGRRMGLVRLNRGRVDPRFFVYQYISPPFRHFLEGKTVRGATVDRIALKEFPSFPISLPPLREQELVADQIDALKEQTEALSLSYQSKLAALETLKASLLHHAFTGQL